MKKFIYTTLLTLTVIAVSAQDFDKNLATAKTSYSSGNLEDARFAMQQMITDLDVAIGKEVIKLLPAKLEAYNANLKSDNVTANTGLAGSMIHRDYGTEEKLIKIDIMSNSPLIGSLNAMLSLPFMGNSGDGSQKQIKVQGYKGIQQKNVDTETNKAEFTIQIPLNNTLLTLFIPDSNEGEATKMINAIPIQQIAKMVQ